MTCFLLNSDISFLRNFDMVKCMNIFVGLLFVLWSVLSLQAGQFNSVLTDHYNRPVHIFAKKENNHIMLIIVSKSSFNGCSTLFAPVQVQQNRPMEFILALKVHDTCNDKVHFDSKNGLHVDVLNISELSKESNTNGWDMLRNGSGMIKIIFSKHEKDTRNSAPKSISFNIGDLGDSVRELYGSCFENNCIESSELDEIIKRI